MKRQFLKQDCYKDLCIINKNDVRSQGIRQGPNFERVIKWSKYEILGPSHKASAANESLPVPTFADGSESNAR
jgi:hypothetical protein